MSRGLHEVGGSFSRKDRSHNTRVPPRQFATKFVIRPRWQPQHAPASFGRVALYRPVSGVIL
jgi:hypothetical protein